MILSRYFQTLSVSFARRREKEKCLGSLNALYSNCPDHPLGSFLPPPFIAEWELVQPLGNNTKLFWGKNEKEWLRLEAARPRSHFALSWGAPLGQGKKRRSLRRASSFLRARARQFRTLFSAKPKVISPVGLAQKMKGGT